MILLLFHKPSDGPPKSSDRSRNHFCTTQSLLASELWILSRQQFLIMIHSAVGAVRWRIAQCFQCGGRDVCYLVLLSTYDQLAVPRAAELARCGRSRWFEPHAIWPHCRQLCARYNARLTRVCIVVAGIPLEKNLLGSVFVRGLCSAVRPKRRPPCGVAQGFMFIPVFSSEDCVRGGAEQNEGYGTSTSRSVRRNMRRTSAF